MELCIIDKAGAYNHQNIVPLAQIGKTKSVIALVLQSKSAKYGDKEYTYS